MFKKTLTTTYVLHMFGIYILVILKFQAKSNFVLITLIKIFRDKHIDTIAKVNYVFMLHLQDLTNASMHFSIENTWGYKDKNNNWSGMIGELTRKKADIGGNFRVLHLFIKSYYGISIFISAYMNSFFEVCGLNKKSLCALSISLEHEPW